MGLEDYNGGKHIVLTPTLRARLIPIRLTSWCPSPAFLARTVRAARQKHFKNISHLTRVP